MKSLIIALSVALAPIAMAKAKKHPHKPTPAKPAVASEGGVKIGDLVVVSNMYRSQYGCGGKVVKIIKGTKKASYVVNIKECDVLTFTRLSQLDRNEFILIK